MCVTNEKETEVRPVEIKARAKYSRDYSLALERVRVFNLAEPIATKRH